LSRGVVRISTAVASSRDALRFSCPSWIASISSGLSPLALRALCCLSDLRTTAAAWWEFSWAKDSAPGDSARMAYPYPRFPTGGRMIIHAVAFGVHQCPPANFSGRRRRRKIAYFHCLSPGALGVLEVSPRGACGRGLAGTQHSAGGVNLLRRPRNNASPNTLAIYHLLRHTFFFMFDGRG